MQTWVVKFFSLEKNYGFIKPNDGSADLFFHGTKVVALNPVNSNDEVEFEVGEGRKGVEAINVNLLVK